LHVFGKVKPTLTLGVTCRNLDYNLQTARPNHPDIARDVAQVDEVCGELIDAAQRSDAHVVALSEYGITEVSRPVHINRKLRQAGWLRVREELGREQLDAGASEAFAVADHQIAHVYVARPELVDKVADLLRSLPAWSACSMGRASARWAWIIRAPGNWWRSHVPTAGSPTIIFLMMRVRRIMRVRWTSTASRATTRWSCSSIRRCR